MLLASSEELTFCPAGIVITHKVCDIPWGPWSACPGSYCSTVLVVGETIKTSSAVSVTGAAACSTHCWRIERDSGYLDRGWATLDISGK